MYPRVLRRTPWTLCMPTSSPLATIDHRHYCTYMGHLTFPPKTWRRKKKRFVLNGTSGTKDENVFVMKCLQGLWQDDGHWQRWGSNYCSVRLSGGLPGVRLCQPLSLSAFKLQFHQIRSIKTCFNQL